MVILSAVRTVMGADSTTSNRTQSKYNGAACSAKRYYVLLSVRLAVLPDAEAQFVLNCQGKDDCTFSV
jgi:hypothetical protein